MITISIITPNTITVVIITAHKWAPKAPGWGWWGLHLGPSTSRCDKAASAASASQISARILQKSGGFEQNYPFIYPKLAEKALPKAELKGWGDTWALRSREHPSSLSAPFLGGGRGGRGRRCCGGGRARGSSWCCMRCIAHPIVTAWTGLITSHNRSCYRPIIALITVQFTRGN